MAGEYPKYPLIEAAIRRSRLPRSWTIVCVAGVLLLLLVLTAFLDGESASLFEWSTVSPTLLNIIFTTYILMVYPFMLRSRGQAVLAFKPLLSLKDDAFNKVAENILKPSRRGEWIAIFAGIFVLGAVLSQPWTIDWASVYFWRTVYYGITDIIGMGLMGWLLYDTLVGIVRVSRLSRHDLKLDILNPETLAPVASWSLGISLVFIGTIILTIIYSVSQAANFVLDWKTITGYLFLIFITLLIFFLSMWSAHRAMSEAKKLKMTLARKRLEGISHELEDQEAKGQRSGMMELSSAITSWATYEKRAKETPTWPFNAAIIRRLLLSISTPGLIYVIKILSQLGIRFDF